MKSEIIKFLVRRAENGYYADAADFDIVVEGRTLEELRSNAIETTRKYFTNSDEIPIKVVLSPDYSDIAFSVIAYLLQNAPIFPWI